MARFGGLMSGYERTYEVAIGVIEEESLRLSRSLKDRVY